MATLEATDVPTAGASLPDFTCANYKDAYSRINAIVIEGEQEAHDNYISIGTLLPDQADELTKLARMEICLLYTSPSPRDLSTSRMPSSA